MRSPEEHDEGEDGMSPAEGQWWETLVALDVDAAEVPGEPDGEESLPEIVIGEEPSPPRHRADDEEGPNVPLVPPGRIRP